MIVKFLDIKPSPLLQMELSEAYNDVISSGRYIGGEYVDRFEEEWARYIGAKNCVSCGNGFDAIMLALMANGIGQGCSVATTPYTCLPTWAAIEATGAIVKPSEINVLFDNIGADAFVPVHLYGIPSQVSRQRNTIVVEDAAQAHGSLYPDGSRIGSKGITAWSFYPTKNLGCYGDGGAITTNDKYIASYLKELRNYGGNYVKPGINSRLDEMQAAFLCVKLRYLDEENSKRDKIARMYTDRIRWPDEYLKVLSPWVDPSSQEYSLTNWHQYVVISSYRDELKSYLEDNGVQTAIHYSKPPHRHTCFSAYKNSFSIADKWSNRVLSLPISGNHTTEEIEYTIDVINRWIGEKCQ